MRNRGDLAEAEDDAAALLNDFEFGGLIELADIAAFDFHEDDRIVWGQMVLQANALFLLFQVATAGTVRNQNGELQMPHAVPQEVRLVTLVAKARKPQFGTAHGSRPDR